MVLAVPLLTFNWKKNQVSFIDNRKLTELPVLSGVSLTDYLEEWKSYFNDRLGLRSAMLSSSVVVQNKLFGVMAHPSYTNGTDGHIFLKLNPQLTDFDYVKKFAAFVADLQTYCNERGTKFLFDLEPNKQMVYSKFLPKGVNYRNDRVEYLLNLLDEENVKHVFTAPALIQASKTTPVFNKKYDAGHWNDTGALVGITRMLQELKKQSPALTLPTKNDYDVVNILHTSLPVSYFPIHEDVPVLSLKNTTSKRIYPYDGELQTNASGWYYTYFKNESLPDAPKILVFMGSYYENKEKFFANSFSEIIFVHSYSNVQNFDYYYNIFQPDIVLFETADYATTDAYYRETDLDAAQFNRAYSNYQSLPEATFASLTGDAQEQLLSTARNSKKELADFSLSYTGQPITAAYLQVDDTIYDLRSADQTLTVTLDKAVIQNAKNISVLLISVDQTKQQRIPLLGQ